MARRSSVLVIATAAVSVTVAVGVAAAADEAGKPRLPDLVAAKPSDLAVLEDENGRWQLGFNSGLENAGDGDLIVDGRAGDEAGRMDAEQVIEHADGTSRQRDLPIPLVFTPDGGHNHWHIVAAMRYELRTPDGEPAARDVKSGFCLGDRYRTTPTEQRGQRYITNCGAAEPELTALRMGLTPGYGDRYNPFLDGQQIDIHDLAAGEYRLVHRANPDLALRESDTTNNESSIVVSITYPNGRAAGPLVEQVDEG